MTGYSSTYKATAQLDYEYRFVCEHCGTDSGTKNAQISENASSAEGNISEQSRNYAEHTAEMKLLFEVESVREHLASQKYPAGMDGRCRNCGKHQSWEKSSAKGKIQIYAFAGLMIGLILFILISLLDGSDSAHITRRYTWTLMPLGALISAGIGSIGLHKIRQDTKVTSVQNLPLVSLPEYPDPLYRGCQPLDQSADIRIDREKKFLGQTISYDIMLNGKLHGSIKNGQSVSLATDFACNSLIIRNTENIVSFSYLFFTINPGGQTVITISGMDFAAEKCSNITRLTSAQMSQIALNEKNNR